MQSLVQFVRAWLQPCRKTRERRGLQPLRVVFRIGFGNPAAIFLAVEFNGENHGASIPQSASWVSAARTLQILPVNLMSKLEGKHLYMVRLPIKRVIL